MSIDANGNIHDQASGRFAGHLQAEANANQVLAAGLTDELRGRATEALTRQRFLEDNNLDIADHTADLVATLTELAAAVGVRAEQANYCDSCLIRIPLADGLTLCERCEYQASSRPVDDPAAFSRIADAADAWAGLVAGDTRAATIADDDAAVRAYLDEVQRRLVDDPALSGRQALDDVLDDMHPGLCGCSDSTHFSGPGHPFGAAGFIVRTDNGVDWCGECDPHRKSYTGILHG